MLVGGELQPRKTLDAFLSAILIVFGTLITSTLFGEIAVLMSNLNRKSTRFQEVQDTANTAMKNMKLPESVQIKISDYLIYTHAMLDTQEEYDRFESNLSPSLKEDVNKIIYGRIIDSNVIFRGNDEIGQFITNRLKNFFSKPEEEIIT